MRATPRLSARRRAAGPRQDARKSAARAGAGHPPAACRAPTMRWLPGARRRLRDSAASAGAARCRRSSMWAANAATVSPAPDTARRPVPPDRRQSRHHAASQPGMARRRCAPAAPRLRRQPAFRGPPARSRRASATRARPTICGYGASHDAPGVEIFVYGGQRRRLPRAPAPDASRAIARLPRARSGAHAVRRADPRGDRRGRVPQRCGRGRQRAGAVRARAGLRRSSALYEAAPRARCPRPRSSWCPPARSASPTAIASYLFNAQLGRPLPSGELALIVPTEARDARRLGWLESHVAGNGPIRQRRAWSTCASRWPMAAAPPACGCGWWPIATIDPRFLVDAAARPCRSSWSRDALARGHRRRCDRRSALSRIEAARHALPRKCQGHRTDWR